MKKLLCFVLLAGLCIGLTGCGSKNDADIAKDVEKKIESAGWEVKHKPQEGTVALDTILIIIDDDYNFGISRDIDKNEIQGISFLHSTSEIYMTSYSLKDKKTVGSHFSSDSVLSCVGYDIENDKVDEKMATSGVCDAKQVTGLKNTLKSRDEFLKEADIEITDLQIWATEYYKNIKE
ncbi:LptM family lipoprotein [Amedibacillus sp. YH-ame10]